MSSIQVLEKEVWDGLCDTQSSWSDLHSSDEQIDSKQ